MNSQLLGLFIALLGLMLYWDGRVRHGRAESGIRPGPTRVPGLLGPIVRGGEGPIEPAALPEQLWGIVAVAVGLAIATGVIPPGASAASAALWLIGPGSILMGAAAFIIWSLLRRKQERDR